MTSVAILQLECSNTTSYNFNFYIDYFEYAKILVFISFNFENEVEKVNKNNQLFTSYVDCKVRRHYRMPPKWTFSRRRDRHFNVTNGR